ncbi:MAG: hypothetical protein HY059_09240 [Proteobacteria bacterium]|nr:hypothetical protein [Pseudomonadota bacterium]
MCAYAGTTAVEYRFTPIVDAAEPGIAVELSFQGEASGDSHIRLPSHWAGQADFDKAIRGLEALTPGAVLRDDEANGPYSKRIAHKPSERVRLRYRVVQDWTGPLTHDHYYRVVASTGGFHAVGHAFMIVPGWSSENTAEITLSWGALPAGWTPVDSFGTGTAPRRFTRPLGDATHALYLAGPDIRLKTLDVRGRPVRVAIRGEGWAFTDDAFITMAGRIITAQRAFFDDDDFPEFLVALEPVERRGDGESSGGTGLTDSFAMFVSTSHPLNARLANLLAHELFHTWNGGKILREDEELSYWFSEGFTEFYTHRLNLRAGVTTLADYVEAYNEKLREYRASPARNAPNARIRDEFWKDRAVEDLPYQRGLQLAHNWSVRIARETKGKASMDDVMRDLFASAKTGVKFSASVFDAAMAKVLPGGVRADLEAYVERGDTIEPDPASLGPCVALERVDVPQWELGFDWRAAKADKVARGVVPGSAAHKAGLRDGQTFEGFSIYHGDTSKQVELWVREASGNKRHFVYWPHRLLKPGAPKDLLPRFTLDEARYKNNPAACLDWFH